MLIVHPLPVYQTELVNLRVTFDMKFIAIDHTQSPVCGACKLGIAVA